VLEGDPLCRRRLGQGELAVSSAAPVETLARQTFRQRVVRHFQGLPGPFGEKAIGCAPPTIEAPSCPNQGVIAAATAGGIQGLGQSTSGSLGAKGRDLTSQNLGVERMGETHGRSPPLLGRSQEALPLQRVEQPIADEGAQQSCSDGLGEGNDLKCVVLGGPQPGEASLEHAGESGPGGQWGATDPIGGAPPPDAIGVHQIAGFDTGENEFT